MKSSDRLAHCCAKPGEISQKWSELRPEYGSDFHLLPCSFEATYSSPWDKVEAGLFGSGRDALKFILGHGSQSRGWRRLLVPSYFCQEVIADLPGNDVEVEVYSAGPVEGVVTHELPDLNSGDVLLVVNYFGIGMKLPVTQLQQHGVEVIEDHTHDPWSGWALSSNADWCFASLRKTLPVPDGGVLWSPVCHTLPDIPKVTDAHHLIALEKFMAMSLKSQYLSGDINKKGFYRKIMISTEHRIGKGVPSGISPVSLELLKMLPIPDWRTRRLINFNAFQDALGGNTPWLEMLLPDDDRIVPYGILLVLDSSGRRDYLQEQLKKNDVYTAVLWSLDGPNLPKVPERHVDLSRRILMMHCDMRYTENDMIRLAHLVKRIGEKSFKWKGI